MNSRSVPAVISFAAPAKIQNQRGRLVDPTSIFFFISHSCIRLNLTCWCSTWPAAGVFEEAVPQGHSQQPCLDAQLLSWLAVRTSGAAQSHQRAAVPCRSQWQHEWNQHPPCKGELQSGQKHKNRLAFRLRHYDWSGPILSVPFCFFRKPWWWHWRVSLLVPCWTLWVSAQL